jgi:hypothetical protein
MLPVRLVGLCPGNDEFVSEASRKKTNEIEANKFLRDTDNTGIGSRHEGGD